MDAFACVSRGSAMRCERTLLSFTDGYLGLVVGYGAYFNRSFNLRQLIYSFAHTCIGIRATIASSHSLEFRMPRIRNTQLVKGLHARNNKI